MTDNMDSIENAAGAICALACRAFGQPSVSADFRRAVREELRECVVLCVMGNGDDLALPEGPLRDALVGIVVGILRKVGEEWSAIPVEVPVGNRDEAAALAEIAGGGGREMRKALHLQVRRAAEAVGLPVFWPAGMEDVSFAAKPVERAGRWYARFEVTRGAR